MDSGSSADPRGNGESSLPTARATREASTLLRWAELPGLELLRANFHRHAYVPHWHDECMISSPAYGMQRIRHKGVKRVLGPGTLTLLNPGELHDGEAEDPERGWHHRALFLSPALLAEAVNGHRGGTADEVCFENSVVEDASAASTFLEIHARLQTAVTTLERETVLAEGLGHLLISAKIVAARDREAAVCRKALGRARDYLHAGWAEPVRLSALAEIADLSPYHFLRSFRSHFGLAPHAYQMQLRVIRAKDLLFDGRAVKDVALEVGFYDQAHLTNVFRRYTGVTPGCVRPGVRLAG
ncbi:AraC family transcriptional regulator [soil metagenome]